MNKSKLHEAVASKLALRGSWMTSGEVGQRMRLDSAWQNWTAAKLAKSISTALTEMYQEGHAAFVDHHFLRYWHLVPEHNNLGEIMQTFDPQKLGIDEPEQSANKSTPSIKDILGKLKPLEPIESNGVVEVSGLKLETSLIGEIRSIRGKIESPKYPWLPRKDEKLQALAYAQTIFNENECPQMAAILKEIEAVIAEWPEVKQPITTP